MLSLLFSLNTMYYQCVQRMDYDQMRTLGYIALDSKKECASLKYTLSAKNTKKLDLLPKKAMRDLEIKY